MKRTLNSVNVVLALLLSSALFYLGASNYRLADTNETLSTDINLLLETMQLDSPMGNRDRPEERINLY